MGVCRLETEWFAENQNKQTQDLLDAKMENISRPEVKQFTDFTTSSRGQFTSPRVTFSDTTFGLQESMWESNDSFL